MGVLLGELIGLILAIFCYELFTHFRNKYRELKAKEEWLNAIQKIKNNKDLP